MKYLIAVLLIILVFIPISAGTQITVKPDTYAVYGHYDADLLAENAYSTGFVPADIDIYTEMSITQFTALSTDDDSYVVSGGDNQDDGYLYVNFSVPNVESINSFNITVVGTSDENWYMGAYNDVTDKWETMDSTTETTEVTMNYLVEGAEVATYSELIDNNATFSIALWESDSAAGIVSGDLISIEFDYEAELPVDPVFSHSYDINITTTGTSMPAGYQVILNISYEDEMQADFDDIRFKNSSDGNLSYWIEDKENSIYANVWVNLSDAITNPDNDTIWIHYGNSTATDKCSIEDTFDYGDDFNREDSATVGDGWTETTDAQILDNALYGTGNGAAWSTASRDFPFSAGTYVLTSSGSHNTFGLRGLNMELRDGAHREIIYMSGWNAAPHNDAIVSLNPDTSLIDPYVVDQFYKIETYRWTTDDFDIYIDNVLEGTAHDPAHTTADNKIYLGMGYDSGANSSFDYVHVRKLIVNEPSIEYNRTETVGEIEITSPSPGIDDIKYVSNQSITYTATISSSANCHWSWDNGTTIEWDNGTTSPSTTIWINDSTVESINVSLNAHEPGNVTNNDSVSWNNSISDDIFVSDNYSWSRWNLFPGEGFVGVVGNIPVGDVDNDGVDEIVLIGDAYGDSIHNRDIIIYETNGTYQLYEDVLTERYRNNGGSIHDIDSDGDNELLVFGTRTSGVAPKAIADLFRFNTTAITDSKLSTVTSTETSNFNKNPSWFNISGEEHFYSVHCGGGDLVNNFINFTTDSKAEIDDYSNSGEDNIVWDIDGDGDDELIVVEGWNTNAAKIWMYEINNVTGAYTSKTMLFDNDYDDGQHWSAAIMSGDVDNDGIDNLLIFWSPTHEPFRLSRIEAYEFDGISEFGEDNYSEGFVIASTSDRTSIGGSMEGHGKAVIGDVDNDGENELIVTQFTDEWGGQDTSMRHVVQYDVETGGASIEQTYLLNLSFEYMGGDTYERHSSTPAIFNHDGNNYLFISVLKQSFNVAVLETEIFVLERLVDPDDSSFTVTLPVGETEINFTAITSTDKLLEPDGQSISISIVDVENTGNIMQSFVFYMNSTVTNILTYTSLSNDLSSPIELNTTTTTVIISNLAASDSEEVWMYCNLTRPSAGTTQKELTVNSS